MNDKEKAKTRCNEILEMCFGAELKQTWWHSKNVAFDLKTPNEIWETDHWGLVYAYLLDQLNEDYL
jgi:hypothetical protein